MFLDQKSIVQFLSFLCNFFEILNKIIYCEKIKTLVKTLGSLLDIVRIFLGYIFVRILTSASLFEPVHFVVYCDHSIYALNVSIFDSDVTTSTCFNLLLCQFHYS